MGGWKMDISSLVEEWLDNEFASDQKGMTSLVVDKMEGVVVGWYYGKHHNWNPLNNVLSFAGIRDMARAF
jgi:hypothetical protein